MSRRPLLVCATALVAVSACEKSKPALPPPNTPEVKPELPPPPAPAVKPGPPLGPEVRATVNGVPITGEQLAVRLAGAGFGEKGERASLEQQQAALEQAILAELQAQRATALGMDFIAELTDGGVPEPVLVEQRRHELAKQYRMKELLQKTLPTHEQIKQFYERNVARVQAELSLQVIAMPNRQTGEAFVAAVRGGKNFDQVAAELYPKVPEPKPWAPATFSFSTLPPRFWAAIDGLQPGQVSAFIAETETHGYVLRLVERKQNPALTLEKMEGAVSAFLQSELFEQRRRDDARELRAAAKVEVRPLPPPPP